ncbi:MAG: LysR family transcriptional regulator [Alphaproteobacteria bacterium]|nr:LysR family transcriptional regulator [Alphaproteobacteria bacterium]
MQLEDLATYVEAVDAGSLAGAARALGVPKSTVSRRLARLEADLGEELVVRHARLFQLTDVGRGLYERTAGAVRDLRRAAQEVHDAHDDLAGELRLSMPQDLGIAEPMVRFLTGFRADHPQIELEVDLSDRRVDLVAERFDFAFRIHLGPLPSTDALQLIRLDTLGGGLFASPAYLARRGTPSHPDQLADHDTVASWSSRGPMPLRMTQAGTGAHLELRFQAPLRSSSLTFPPTAAALGAGIAYVPFFAAAARVARGELVPVLPGWEVGAATLSLVWPTSRLPHPRRRAFLAACRAGLDLRAVPAAD